MVDAMKQTFKATLTARGPGGAWTFLPIPFNVQEAFGTRARVSVSGTINGFAFRNSLMPEGDGTHSMMVSKELQAGAKAKAGDTVSVVIDKDTKERTIETPKELELALRKHKQAAAVFSTLAYSHKKEYIDWITSAKQEQTKATRIAKAIEMLAEGQKRLR
jgi:hypothetical protein